MAATTSPAKSRLNMALWATAQDAMPYEKERYLQKIRNKSLDDSI